MIRVLAVASEVFPLVKTGGLADVVGALPAALKPHQVDMRVLVPGYPAITSVLKKAEPLDHYPRLFGGSATLIAGTAAGLDLLVLDAPHLFDRPGNPYLAPGGGDWADNWKRFAALSRVAADIGTGKLAAFRPDVVHCHDWHAGLVPALAALCRGRRREVGDDHPQPGLSGRSSRRRSSPPSGCPMPPSPSTASNILAASAS